MVNQVQCLNKNESTDKQANENNLSEVFRQNIRGLKSKADQLINSLFPEYPCIMCLTEHHLKDYEIDNLYIDHYKLGSKCCRQEFKNGGVGTFFHEDLELSTIPLVKYCKERDIEVCAVKLNVAPIKLIIVALHGSPSGNFSKSLKNVDSVLNTWYSNSRICYMWRYKC